MGVFCAVSKEQKNHSGKHEIKVGYLRIKLNDFTAIRGVANKSCLIRDVIMIVQKETTKFH